MGFIAFNVDTSIHEDLRMALVSYTGPKVRINSLRRHWGTKSDHERGKAVDFDLCPSIVEYLTSEQGQKWLKEHSLMFYIEGRPGSREVKTYEEKYAQYVFYNPKATGPHIHIEFA